MVWTVFEQYLWLQMIIDECGEQTQPVLLIERAFEFGMLGLVATLSGFLNLLKNIWIEMSRLMCIIAYSGETMSLAWDKNWTLAFLGHIIHHTMRPSDGKTMVQDLLFYLFFFCSKVLVEIIISDLIALAYLFFPQCPGGWTAHLTYIQYDATLYL